MIFPFRFILTALTASFVTLVLSFSFTKHQNSILTCFNFCKHFYTILDTKSISDEISCLHGMRVLTMIAILIYHSVMAKISVVDPQSKLYKVISDNRKLLQVIHVMTIVDTFFVIGAILLTRSILKDLRMGKFNYLRNIINRYCRMAPTLLFVMLLSRLLNATLKERYTCNDIFCQTWWKNLLFIQNVVLDQTKEGWVRKEVWIYYWIW